MSKAQFEKDIQAKGLAHEFTGLGTALDVVGLENATVSTSKGDVVLECGGVKFYFYTAFAGVRLWLSVMAGRLEDTHPEVAKAIYEAMATAEEFPWPEDN